MATIGFDKEHPEGLWERKENLEGWEQMENEKGRIKKIYITGEEGTQVIPSESLKAQTVLRLNGAQDKEEL